MPEEKCSRPDEISISALEAAICDGSYYPSQLLAKKKASFHEKGKHRHCLIS